MYLPAKATEARPSADTVNVVNNMVIFEKVSLEIKVKD
jgi:hypothetical protein